MTIYTPRKNKEPNETRDLRYKLGLNQFEFWSMVGVTQSGGSRYENGRNIPRPVQELLRLVHVEGINIHNLKREDVDIVDYLKSEDTAAYKSLKRAAKSWKKSA
jgi:transcriptional regulator with XRE-family HTH domain